MTHQSGILTRDPLLWNLPYLPPCSRQPALCRGATITSTIEIFPTILSLALVSAYSRHLNKLKTVFQLSHFPFDLSLIYISFVYLL